MCPAKIEVRPPKFVFPKLHNRTVIYCRVSSKSDDQLISLASQVSGLVRSVSQKWHLQLVDVYFDVTGGERQDRSEFNRMLDDAERGAFDVLIVKSIARFGRDTVSTLKALRLLNRLNIEVIFEQEQLSTYKDSSELIISIYSAVAQAENESRRGNQIWAMKKRLEDGTSEIYIRPCYWYMKNTSGILEIDSKKAEIVQLIFSSYLNGASIIGIQRILKEAGVVSPKGNETWSKRSIENILSNEKYMGDVIARKTMVSPSDHKKRIINETEGRYMAVDIVAPLITREIFEAVAAERERRSNITRDEGGTIRKSTHYSSKRSAAYVGRGGKGPEETMDRSTELLPSEE